MTDIWNWAEREIHKKGEVDSGTSIIAVEFEGGVVLGADSRTSTGSYVANRVSDKLTEVHNTIYCCRSGSAADTQAISDIVRYQLASHGVSLGEKRNPQVKTAATLFRKFCYDYKDQLMAGIIVAGWDEYNGGKSTRYQSGAQWCDNLTPLGVQAQHLFMHTATLHTNQE